MASGKQRPEHRSIVVLDITGSGRWDNRTQLNTRAALNAMVRTAFRAARVPKAQLVIEDRGDGMIALVPATVSKADLLSPMIPALAAAVGKHNAATPQDSRIHLRVSVHAGEIHRDAYGWAGVDLNLACRLVNCTAAYQQSPHAGVVVVVSELIHHGIVRHGYDGIDPARYIPIQVDNKEVSTQAWLHLPEAAKHPVAITLTAAS
ncbi:hypothetical protein [Kibdelosporangium aridum]|uniref:Guanylate cyclase domain-containing protein n=1 Tax=Kibdelosporangium aridum TaxID=2030 RepID=A0A1W2FZL0_KIBAR|nr:hypothetical protein [Kibdelosporangium aridum]SMD27152.1 hypothetical protein SAMN05661093_10749 [Kibdelosporangium aridum]